MDLREHVLKLLSLSEDDQKPLIKWFDAFEKELKKVRGSYSKIKPTDMLKLYYKGVTPAKAAVQLKEATVTAKNPLVFRFPNEKSARQFAYEVENSAVASAEVAGNRVELIDLDKTWTRVDASAVKKYMRANRGKLVKESVELDERLAHSFKPDARMLKGIESGKFPLVKSKLSILGGNSIFGVFQFTGKAAGGGPEPGEKQGSGYVDGYVMAITSDPKRGSIKLFAYYGSHPDPDGAINKFARSHKLLGESVELDELRKDVFCIVDRKGKVLAAKLDRKQSHKEADKHKNVTIVLDPDAKVGDTLKYFAEGRIVEVSPPGWEGTVKAMKKHKEIDNPWALAWSMKNKGYKSHKPVEEDLSDDEMCDQHGICGQKNNKHLLKNPLRDYEKDELEGAAEYTKGKENKVEKKAQKVLHKEDTAVNNVGDGEIAGAAPGEEPPVRKKRKKFAGCDVFEVSPDVYYKCIQGKKKFEHWRRYFDRESGVGSEIYEFAYKHPRKAIIVQNEVTREMVYLRNKRK